MKKIIVFLLILLPFTVDAKTVKYLNDNAFVNVNIESNQIEVSLNGKKSLLIENMSSYYNAFMEGNYPNYLLYADDTYSFSNTADKSKLVFTVASKYNKLETIDPTNSNIKSCKDLFGVSLINFLKGNIFRTIYILVPIILLVLTTLDFSKIVFSDSKDDNKKAFQRFGKRVVAAILIYLTPTILIFPVSFMYWSLYSLLFFNFFSNLEFGIVRAKASSSSL